MKLLTRFKLKFPFLQNFPECSSNYLILGHTEIKGKIDMDSSYVQEQPSEVFYKKWCS